ncbi:MAG TPA: GDP-mannose 4,6-dehydratase [Candidatus Sulfotelmatobacter sp.]|jgi:GDPmannose 4,6-dehydratase|nr:GDP-mannose 4,6-dehydratase [Candidatus Sulfotelmatobacter sp.]
MRRAFITGVGGQDGSYLAEFLLAKGYEVHGLLHRSAKTLSPNLLALQKKPQLTGKNLILHPGDLDDADSIRGPLHQAAPDEIYHLAGQSHVGGSFEKIEESSRVTALGTVRLLELARELPKSARFFYASSSEIFGSPQQSPQDENTPVAPITPYGCAKAFGTQLTRVYRKTFGLFAVNGILYNHESPRRGVNFVTQKICQAAAQIKAGRQKELVLGDTNAQRDWGNARDYVRGMWQALQHDVPEDFVFATGKLHRVQDIVEIAFREAGLDWRKFLRQDPAFFRPADPHHLVGNPAKANQLLGWAPEISFEQTIVEITQAAISTIG